MKPSNVTLLFSAITSVFVMSCSRNSENEIGEFQSLSAASIVASNAAPVDKAEKLATVADTLFSAGAFQQAIDVTDAALAIDSNNLRAGLISALAKPLLNMKGIILRAAPLAVGNSNSHNANLRAKYLSLLGAERYADYSRFRNFSSIFTDADFYNPASFFSTNNSSTSQTGEAGLLKRVTELDAKTPGYAFKTEADLQVVLDQTIESFEQLRSFTKAHKSEQISITATALLIPDFIERYASACVVKESPTLVYELKCPPDETRTHVLLNRADFELIGDIAAYYEFMFSVVTAYDVPGLSRLSLEADPYSYQSLDVKSIMDALVAAPGFGRLRSQNKLQNLKSMGLDLVGGLNWALANQESLCKEKSHFRTRQGYVFNDGFCVGANLSQALDLATKVVSGQTLLLNVGGPHTAEFKPFAAIDNPIADLLTLKPVFNSFGALISVSDQTLGGAFPKSEADYVLKTSAGETTL